MRKRESFNLLLARITKEGKLPKNFKFDDIPKNDTKEFLSEIDMQKEWHLIKQKKSRLTYSQRELVKAVFLTT